LALFRGNHRARVGAKGPLRLRKECVALSVFWLVLSIEVCLCKQRTKTSRLRSLFEEQNYVLVHNQEVTTWNMTTTCHALI
jgi:hypothetical protein